ncbi:MAG: EVE domain-containing protein, partial [Chlamydiia bacterium]|nr:EVE domain-containing protein [Chlamydiia bacterium]
MRYWLMKSEPDTYSIDDLKRDCVGHWDGVRNYQARNYMRDQMHIGDLILFYHSNAKPPGVVGIAKVCKEAYPDHTAQDPNSKYFDSKASDEDPRWMMVDIEYVTKFPRIVSLDEMRDLPSLAEMVLLKK